MSVMRRALGALLFKLGRCAQQVLMLFGGFAARGFAVGLIMPLAMVAMGLLASAAPASARTHWQPVFFDDFNSLQPSAWGAYSGQPGGDPGGWWDPSHVTVSRGVLNLQTYRDPRFGGRWVSGGVSNGPGLKQTYGKYEVRARVDRGYGVLFAVLLWPADPIWPPEIDIAENLGADRKRKVISAFFHYGAKTSQTQRALRVDWTRWHTVGVEWTPGRIVYTIDGRAWSTIRSRAVPAIPMELDLQTQAGICGDLWEPCPNRSTPTHVNAQVQWVKAYAWEGR